MQFVLELQEVLVGLEVRVAFADRQQPRQAAGKQGFGPPEAADGGAVLGVGGGVAARALRLVAGLGDPRQGFPLMVHVGLGGFHQVGYQIVAPLQLHVDLREGVLEAVLKAHQPVVNNHQPDADGDQYAEKQPGPHGSLPLYLLAMGLDTGAGFPSSDQGASQKLPG